MAPANRPRSLRSAFSFVSGRRASSPGPPSPTFSEATNVSAMNLGANGPSKIITRANLKSSIQAYEDLVNSCSTYRAALVAMSKATASFADAMERCSGLKGPTYEAGTRLLAASGMHHLMGNLWQVLSDTLDKKVEKPLRQTLDSYRTVVQERSQDYEQTLKEKSRIIHETETRSLNRKSRNLQSFREALAILQRQVDELDELKVSHYQEIMDHEEEIWNGVQSKVCVAVRSTMDVFDRVTAKASDPIIEPMLQTVPDPFDSYGPPQSENQIFSILAPLSIMSPSPSPSPVVGTPENYDRVGSVGTDSSVPHPSHSQSHSLAHPKITSWLPSASNGVFPIESTDWAHTASSVPSSVTGSTSGSLAGSGSGFTSPISPTPSSPTTPTSVPSSASPPSAGGIASRRHSVPPSRNAVKAESKLRSVLPPIEELHPPTTPTASSHVHPAPASENANSRPASSSSFSLAMSNASNSIVAPFINAAHSWTSGRADNTPSPVPQLINSTGIWDYELRGSGHFESTTPYDDLDPDDAATTRSSTTTTTTTTNTTISAGGGQITPRNSQTTLFSPPPPQPIASHTPTPPRSLEPPGGGSPTTESELESSQSESSSSLSSSRADLNHGSGKEKDASDISDATPYI
ncbi:hypothetical protein CC1G_00089 [Coprinopsis cinerea okayama7|uniref:IMD domain-containing protein n=1 Tax=Coprinopsis cinerea (strain Okayama-7 / 130 / ATCC MYA-4618 / FGSC 9003) TaxID=240176 RepID=A8NWP9_COPC7|nr:hypothetical protein CC1G_00089 [Coprinopsis cinerea okayama7\|eukprot:XP_001836953.2 hypothetical protein CC1G_00089 [Coprinopsis cinerea okayama7\